MSLVCPKCGSEIEKKDALFVCVNADVGEYDEPTCDFKIWKNTFGTVITEEDAEALINGDTIEKDNLVSKAGKQYTGFLTYSPEESKIILSFPDNGGGSSESEPDENGIVTFSKGYKKDGVVVWKEFCQQEITYDEAKELLEGGTVNKVDLVSKKGNTFSANLSIVEGKIDLSFD